MTTDVRRYVRSVAAAGLASTTAYVLLLWDFTFAPFRTALPYGAFSNFYDAQGRALLHGHLALPKGTLGIEAFVVDGRELTYFPPGPAILRMPILALTHRFDGRMTALSMLAAWVVTLVIVSLLLWRVRRIMRGDAPLGRWEAAGMAVLLVASTAGSVLLFLASLPWVYHEAYTWAVPMALGAAYSLLGVLERPSGRGALAAGLFTLGAVLCRTTSGWACAGATVLAGLWLWRRGRSGEADRTWRLLVLAGAVPLAIGIAINWAKFRHPYLFPLEDQAWTKVNAHRRAALAANGGDLISLDILPSTVVNYFRPDGMRLIPLLPFITLPATVAHSFGGGFLDQTYRTGSVPDFMPLLFVLAVWGLITAFRPGGPRGAPLLRIPLLGVLAIPGGIMFYGYIAYRYTSEFMPLLVLGAAVGFVDLARRWSGRSRRARTGVLAAMAAVVALSVAANGAVAFSTQREASPGPSLRDYVIDREKLSSLMGDPIDRYVTVADDLPTYGRADELAIIGACDAMYLGTGDALSPWNVVEAREKAFEVTVDDGPVGPKSSLGEVPLVRLVGHNRDALVLQRSGRGRYRLVYGTGREALRSFWFDAPPGDRFVVEVHTDPKNGRYLIDVEGNDLVGLALPMGQFDEDWFAFPNQLEGALPGAASAHAQGLQIDELETPHLHWCERILARQ